MEPKEKNTPSVLEPFSSRPGLMASSRQSRPTQWVFSSRQEGVEWLVKASGVVPQAATALGNIYYQYLNDAETAAAWYEKGAMAGDPRAQHVFAEMLLLGEPVEKDSERGLAMLRMAAGQDYAPAIARLINVLRNGKAAADNEKEAAAWSARLQELKKEEQPAVQK